MKGDDDARMAFHSRMYVFVVGYVKPIPSITSTFGMLHLSASVMRRRKESRYIILC